MRDAIKIFFGSVVVYLVMAACASERGGGGGDDDDPSGRGGRAARGGRGATGATGATGTGGMGRGGGIADVLTDPVPDAAAETVSGTRLRARHYVGDDGSRQFVGWRDTQRNEDCAFQSASDRAIRCMPYATVTSTFYLDAACTMPIFGVYNPPAGPCPAPAAPRYGSALVANCSAYVLHALTPTAAPAAVYSGGPGSCTSVTVPTTNIWYAGSAVPPTDFVAANEALE